MKQQHSEQIERRKHRLSDRLSRASRPVKRGPVFAGGNERLEVAERVVAPSSGGLGLFHRLVRQIGLPELIDADLNVFQVRSPYHESDHVLNIAYNILCGGRTLDDIELRRQDEAYMNLLGAPRIPGSTTAGDFLRRLDRGRIDTLSESINTARIRVWKKQKRSFIERAIMDVDGTIAGTEGECNEGMDMSYNETWGYAPLLVTLANTAEIRFHFYITNLTRSELPARQVIRNANERCNQENLIERSKNGVHAMRMPCDTLLANEAYMLIACLAWNLKQWAALLWPDRTRGVELQRMEFRRFISSVVAIPCQVVCTGRQIVQRFLGYSSWLGEMLVAHASFKRMRFV